jgi:hypothetical protein
MIQEAFASTESSTMLRDLHCVLPISHLQSACLMAEYLGLHQVVYGRKNPSNVAHSHAAQLHAQAGFYSHAETKPLR